MSCLSGQTCAYLEKNTNSSMQAAPSCNELDPVCVILYLGFLGRQLNEPFSSSKTRDKLARQRKAASNEDITNQSACQHVRWTVSNT